jgi:hypothetical protein
LTNTEASAGLAMKRSNNLSITRSSFCKGSMSERFTMIRRPSVSSVQSRSNIVSKICSFFLNRDRCFRSRHQHGRRQMIF